MNSLAHRARGAHRLLPPALAVSALLLLAALPLRPQAGKPSAPAASPSSEFYIVSSVDLAKKELLLKRPTEVTELMRVDDHTRYLEKNGKPLKLTDLRAGDTVYVTAAPSPRPDSPPVAAVIAKGPMTVDELRRRYLQRTH